MALGATWTVLLARWQFQGFSVVFFEALLLNILHAVKNAVREALGISKTEQSAVCYILKEGAQNSYGDIFCHTPWKRGSYISQGYLNFQCVQTATGTCTWSYNPVHASSSQNSVLFTIFVFPFAAGWKETFNSSWRWLWHANDPVTLSGLKVPSLSVARGVEPHSKGNCISQCTVWWYGRRKRLLILYFLQTCKNSPKHTLVPMSNIFLFLINGN